MSNVFVTMFARMTQFLGRNGVGQCKGVDVYRNGHEIWLQPIHSRGGIARCRIEVPLESVDDLIEKLRACQATGPSVLPYVSPSSVVQPIRIKITANMCDNISYLTIRGNQISYSSESGVPLALSNMFPKAKELQFALEDSKSPDEALAACKAANHYAKKIELV
jgi:hypothetical protein